MDRKEIVEANRAAWNEAEPYHRRAKFEELLEGFRTPGFSCLDAVESRLLLGLGIEGKDVIQLCCNNGRELLSIKNLGARRCVGVDLADAFVGQARELAAAGRIDAEFVASDVYALPAAYEGGFDVVYVTIGAICWLPDLGQFLDLVKRLLRPGGRFFLYDQHPVLWVFDPAPEGDAFLFNYPYFMEGPIKETHGLDYWTGKPYAARPNFAFQHTLGSILQGLIDRSFRLEHFAEHPHDISTRFGAQEKKSNNPPMSMTLVARSEGRR
jgi:SAM-dependent methyltransferase